MTVLDASAAVDYLLGTGVAADVEALMASEDELAAPDLIVLEIIAVLRREVNRDHLGAARATGAIEDIGGLRIDLRPSLPLRGRAWQLRQNFTVADALYLALAEALDEPFATKDGALASAATTHTAVRVLRLTA